jgi:F-type H+-transporting ATPase subunit a
LKPKTLAIVVGIIVLVGVGFFFFKLPQPVIEIAPEAVFDIGPFTVTNTILTAWVMIILICGGLWLGTRKLTLVPSGFQNVLEFAMEALGNIVNNVAGEQKGRRFFPLIFIFFSYIVLCNWAALTPLFNVIGVIHDEGHHIYEEAHAHPADQVAEAEKIEGYVLEKAGFTLLPRGAELVHVDVPLNTTFAQRAELLDAELRQSLKLPAGANVEEYLHEHHLTFGLIAPFLRGVNSDINAPLSFALWSAIFVEFWGFATLGVLGYGSKFFNIKGGPIYFFVGILELVSEFARLISFTFRLFGNIFAGEVLLFMMSFLVPFLLVDVFYALEIFVGLVQAFVFSMLTLVFAVMATTGHGDHDEAHGDAHAEGGAHAPAHA